MSNPKVSVVIPVYNVEKYLRECLDSVVCQSLPDIEIILVDDGSTDSSGLICDEYLQKYSNIKVIHQENQYVGIARNNGMDIATGDYLIFLDSDDSFDPQLIEKMYNKALETNSDIIICKERAYYENECEYSQMDWAQKQEVIPNNVFSGEDIPDEVLNFCVLWPWDKLYKRSFLIETNIRYPLDRKVAASEDLVFVGHTLVKAKKIVFLKETLITHRYHSKSLAATRNKYAASLSHKMLAQRLKDEGLYEKYQRSFLNLILGNLLWSLSVAKDRNGEKKLAKEAFRYFKFQNYEENYFYDKNQYYEYYRILHPIKSFKQNFIRKCMQLKILFEIMYI